MNEQQARQAAIRILDEFEEVLNEHGIVIPSPDRSGGPEEACLYGSTYYALEDAITAILAKVPKKARTAQGGRAR